MATSWQNLPTDTVYADLETPIGWLGLLASRRGLHCLLFKVDELSADSKRQLAEFIRDETHPVIKLTKSQLQEYFAGERQEFDLPLAPIGTPFQLKVWQILREIPYGQTISYAEQAARLGDRKKARAVGTANSHNPLGVIVPCHRVIAANGALSGFGGGVPTKRFLFDFEKSFSHSASDKFRKASVDELATFDFLPL